MTRLRTLVSNQNNRLKFIALIAGYNLWLIYSSSLSTTVTIPFPLYIYNLAAEHTFTAPESIKVTLQGTYHALRSLDDQVGVHIDGANLPIGNSKIPITQSALLLPRNVHMLHYRPSVIELTVT